MATIEVCVACGHDIGLHFQNVLGKVRCVHASHNMIAMHTHCDCTDYQSPDAERRAEWQRKAEEKRQKEIQVALGRIAEAAEPAGEPHAR